MQGTVRLETFPLEILHMVFDYLPAEALFGKPQSGCAPLNMTTG